ncbi:MAG: ATP-binding protein [Actinomycetota bacterium]
MKRSLDGVLRVWVLNSGIALAAFGIYWFGVRRLSPLDSPVEIPWLLLAGLFCLAEIFVVHLHFRRDAHSFSLSEIPLVMGLFFVSPSGLIAGQLLGAFLGLAFYRRQSALKLVFNVGRFCLEAGLAVVVFRAIVDRGDPIGAAGWAGALTATLVTSIVGVVMIAVAISLSEGARQFAQVPQTLRIAVVITVANTSLALVGATIMWRDAHAAWLLLVPTTILFFSYRAYTAQRQRHESLESLYITTRALQQSLEIEATILTLVSQAREMFRADIAEILLLPSPDGETGASRTTLGPGDEVEVMTPVELDPCEGVWARVLAEKEGLLLARPIANVRLREYFGRRGIRDAMAVPLRGEAGIAGTILVGNRMGDVSTFDIEDLKLFETLANHASISLENARLVDRLEESLVTLTEANRLKDDFVASVSHELRTPLTSIQGYAKTLLRKDVDFLPEQQKLFLETINRQSERLRQLIEDLLVVARLESHDDRPQAIATTLLGDIALHVADEVRSRAHGHSLALDFEDGMPPVATDTGKVHQIILNLVDNALKYAGDDTSVTIRGRSRSHSLVVSVEDEGPGIAAEQQDRIFDRFYQVDQSITRKVGGTGLGLYICKKLAHSIGADVWLERSDAHGSVFCLRLPVATSVTPRPLDVGHSPLIVLEGGARSSPGAKAN